jgi:hypothetical protein
MEIKKIEGQPDPKNPPVETNDDGRDPLDSIDSGNPLDLLLNPDGTDEGDKSDEDGKSDDKGTDDGKFTSADRTRLDKMEERAIASEQQAKYFQGQATILQEQIRSGQRKDEPLPKEEPVFQIDSKEALAKRLEADPAGTLIEMFAGLADKINGKITKTKEETAGELRQRDASAQYNKAYQDDMNEAITEFGKDLLESPDFIKDGDVELARIIRLRGGKTYLPGDFFTASSRVHAKWQREGKLEGRSNGNNGNGDKGRDEGQRPSLREITRRPRMSDDTGSNGDGQRRGGGKTLHDLGLSPLEERIARQNMKGLGVSESDWVKSHLASEREDASFGR